MREEERVENRESRTETHRKKDMTREQAIQKAMDWLDIAGEMKASTWEGDTFKINLGLAWLKVADRLQPGDVK